MCLRELGAQSNYIPDVIPETDDAEDHDDLEELRERLSVEEVEEHGYARWWPDLFEVSSYEPAETEDDFTKRDAQQLVYSVMWDGANARAYLTGAELNNKAVAEAGFEEAERDEFLDQNSEGFDGVVKDLVFEDERDHWEEVSAIAITGLRVEDNYEFNALQDEWLDCMAAHGYDEATPRIVA